MCKLSHLERLKTDSLKHLTEEYSNKLEVLAAMSASYQHDSVAHYYRGDPLPEQYLVTNAASGTIFHDTISDNLSVVCQTGDNYEVTRNPAGSDPDSCLSILLRQFIEKQQKNATTQTARRLVMNAEAFKQHAEQTATNKVAA